MSRPSRARGLKRNEAIITADTAKSRPSRARGLKPTLDCGRDAVGPVAPLAGAWIETIKNRL